MLLLPEAAAAAAGAAPGGVCTAGPGPGNACGPAMSGAIIDQGGGIKWKPGGSILNAGAKGCAKWPCACASAAATIAVDTIGCVVGSPAGPAAAAPRGTVPGKLLGPLQAAAAAAVADCGCM